jgi:hypothetical protein
MGEGQDNGRVPRRRHWLIRWLIRGVISLVILAAIGIGTFLYKRHVAERELQAALAELDEKEPGWRLEDIEARRAQVPEVQNGALHVLAARKLLPHRWPDPAFTRAHDEAFEDLVPNRRLDARQEKLLREETNEYHTAVAQALKLVDYPTGRYSINYTDDWISTLVIHAQDARSVASLLSFEGSVRLQDNDAAGAVTCCTAAMNSGRSIGDEPVMLSQIVRMGCMAIFLRTTERMLGQCQPGENDLSAIQQMVEREQRHPYFLISVFSERAGDQRLFTALEIGRVKAEDFAEPPAKPDALTSCLGPYYRYLVVRGHPQVLRLMTEAIGIARLPVEARGPLLRQWEVKAREGRAHNPMSVMLPALTKVGDADLRLQAELRCMTVALAMERFRIKNGHWPERMDDLKPDYLAEVPIDPYDSQPIRCRRLADGFVIYCIGPDHEDNGGTLDRKKSTRPGADVGFRLYDVDQRHLPAETEKENGDKAPE